MYAAVQKQIDEIKDQAREIGASKFNKALAEFGFNMAAAASQHGMGGGLGGALRAAGAAAPSIMRSVKETEDLERKYAQLGKQMEVSLMQARVAAEKSDKQTAVQSVRAFQNDALQRQQLAEQIQHNRATERIAEGRMQAQEDKRRTDLARASLMARRIGEERARNEFKDILNAQDLKSKGVTYEQLAKRYSDEEYQKFLMSMTSLQPAE
jgi:flavin-dependent dehydrogenase